MNHNKIRYAVVGLGWIAQESVLPAFAHAKKKFGSGGHRFRQTKTGGSQASTGIIF